MTELPAPLTPPDCDLRDFKFMPLEVVRLRKSKAWLIAKRDPAIAFYLINLWTAAWHNVPAASLEDDNDVLADLAMCDPKRWEKVRDAALRGWVKCSDGRLYHPVVAEKAITSWESKTALRQRTKAAREAREQKRLQALLDGATETVTDIATQSVTDAATEDVTTNVTGSKYKEKVKEKDKDREERKNPLAGVTRARRLAADWQPDLAERQFARDLGLDPDAVAAQFRDHWAGKAGKDGTKADWPATWRNWCRREPSMALRNGSGSAPNRDTKTGRRAAFVLPMEPAT